MPNELTNPNNVVTEERLAQFYQQILPYLGGMPDVLANKFNRADLYSTDEKLIGRWIDGKPLYQKTMSGLNFMNTSKAWANVLNDQSEFERTCNIDTIVSAIASRLSDSSCSSVFSLRYNSTTNRLQYYVDGENLTAANILTFIYTKTTDSAVEIGDDTDYSTTEKIVGTWIDGKPIWQKTVTYNGQVGTSNVTIGNIGSDRNVVVKIDATIKTSSSDEYVTINGTTDSDEIFIEIEDDGDVRVKSDSVWSNATVYATIQYTKTS